MNAGASSLKIKKTNELGVFMCLVFLAVIKGRGCAEGQKLFFLEVSRTSPSDKIKLMWLLVLISKAAGCCSVWDGSCGFERL